MGRWPSFNLLSIYLNVKQKCDNADFFAWLEKSTMTDLAANECFAVSSASLDS
jgi:hypothetical protein